MFQDMKERIDDDIVRLLWGLRPMVADDAARRPPPMLRRPPLVLNDPAGETASPFPGTPRPQTPPIPFGPPGAKQPPRVGGDDAAVKTIRRDEPKVGRNDPCPCGSGKKYKKCHGAAA